MKYATREKISALSVFAGALMVVFFVIPTFIDQEEAFELISLSPAFFPTLAAWVIAGLAALQFLLITLEEKSERGYKTAESWLSAAEERNAYISAVVIAAYVWSMKYVGFLISTPLALASLMALQDIRRPARLAVVSVSVTLFVYLFFYFVMKVHFPQGHLFE